MATILVTGSAGFIGFFVSLELLKMGHRVIGIDNFNSYYLPRLKKRRDEILKGYSNYFFTIGELSDREFVDSVYDINKPDLVLHLAAQAGVRYSLKNPYSYQKSNLEAFVNVIEKAKVMGLKRFVYASSSSVYGGNTKMPYSEDDPVNTPISLYAATKRSNELMAFTYTHLWKLQTIGLRFFTVYGPWGRPDMAYWSFLDNMRHEEPIKVFNYGKNMRDFTYIDDIVSGVISALFSENLDPYEIINLGNNKPTQLMEFIGNLEDLSGMKAITQMVEAQPGDVVATFADITKAQEKLNFQPSTDLKEGLKNFVIWFNEQKGLVDEVREFRKNSGQLSMG